MLHFVKMKYYHFISRYYLKKAKMNINDLDIWKGYIKKADNVIRKMVDETIH